MLASRSVPLTFSKNLLDAAIFRPEHLLTIRDLINQSAPIHSWAPLKSFRRIVVSFFDIESAIRIRQVLDGEYIMGDRVRIFFGGPTPIEPVDQHLSAPKSQKLFFISPPPSPPHGWQVKNEDPPNKDVHAEDLATALAKLHPRSDEPASPVSPMDWDRDLGARERTVDRGRSGSITIYHPKDHSDNEDLPSIAVEDTTGSPEPILENPDEKPISHTARPPVELLQDA
jgi:hypothetical protein